jgi:hypothetical protein
MTWTRNVSYIETDNEYVIRRRKMKRIETEHFVVALGFIFLLAFIWPPVLLGDVPNTINYQGYLSDTSGNPVPNNTYSMTFSLYTSASGGSAEWSEDQAVIVIDGNYNVELANVSPFPDSIFEDPLFLGVAVAPDPEMSPRQRLTSSPFAMNAGALDGLKSTNFLIKQAGTGNVGIGVANPTGKLEVAGIITSRGTGLDGGIRLANPNGGIDYRFIQKDDGRLTITDETAAEERLIIDANGNVGIGTIPAVKLDVFGDAHISGVLTVGSGSKSLAIFTDGSVVDIGSYGSTLGINYPGTTDTVINVGGGKVGIGTANPLQKLQVDDGHIFVRGIGGFDEAGEEAILFLGDAFNYIKAKNGTGVSIGAILTGDALNIQQVSGNVGIGTDNPNWGKLQVYTNNQNNAIYALNDGAGSGLFAESRNIDNGRHGVEGATYSNNPIYAGVLAQNFGAGPGIIANAGSEGYAGKFNGIVSVKVLEITGADLSEQYTVRSEHSGMSPSPGKVVSIDPRNPGDMVVSHTAYDRKVAGIISGAGDISIGMLMGKEDQGFDSKNPVALTGRVYCLADASNGIIKPGDLLTTSNVPGHAMKVSNYERAQGAILGKAMSSLEEERGLVLVLVTLQ